MRVILNVHQDVGEVPLIRLRVVGKVEAQGHVVSPLERLLERQLVLERRNGLRDVPLASCRDQAIRVAVRRRATGGVEHVRVCERVLWRPHSSTVDRVTGGNNHPTLAVAAPILTEIRVHGGGRVLDIEGQEGVPFLLVLHDLRTVLDVPSLCEIEARGGGEPVCLGLEPVVQWQEQLTVRCRDRDVIALIRVHRAVVREPRDVLVTLQVV